MCATCDKGVYGTMNADLLAHKKLAKAFKSWGFTTSRHDPCGWNKIETDNQITIMFHIDDLMKSHELGTVEKKCIKFLDEACGSKDHLTVKRDRTHECLGMKIDFSVKRGVTIMQYDFIKNLWLSLPLDLKGGHLNTSVPDSLFKLDRNVLLLNHDRIDKCRTTA